MKKILGILLLTAAMAGGDQTYGTKDNPGLVDDPGCKNLIKAQLRDNKQDPKDYTITFLGSNLTSGNEVAMNQYVITRKADGKQVLAIIGLHFGPMPAASPTPSPSPSPSPAGLITTHV